MKILVGLGNIGREYDNTRHNIGFMFVDYFISEILKEKTEYKKRDNYYYIETNYNNQKIVIIKPTTYMNLSGEAVIKAKNWYKVEENDVVVIYDDIDLNLGSIRYRQSGSAGTHNGMKNIIYILRTDKLKRIRIGMENRENENISLMDYVLSKLTKKEKEILISQSFKEASEILKGVIEEA